MRLHIQRIDPDGFAQVLERLLEVAVKVERNSESVFDARILRLHCQRRFPDGQSLVILSDFVEMPRLFDQLVQVNGRHLNTGDAIGGDVVENTPAASTTLAGWQ